MKNIQHSTFNAEHSTMTEVRRRWALGVECWLLNVPQFLLISAIRAYQLVISPAQTFLFGPTGGCRFTPSCSQYAIEAIRAHGAVAGTALAARRICRCHPFGTCGHDPVPRPEHRTPHSQPRI
jgi:putative membrane protein insertion efficiency factor